MCSPTTHLVRGVQVASVLGQTLHDVVVAPGGGRQQGRLPFSVLDVDVAAGFAEGFGHGVVAVPGGTVQRGLFLLAGRQGQSGERKRRRGEGPPHGTRQLSRGNGENEPTTTGVKH